MTHGFDDEGRKFDARGNLSDWWTADDVQRLNDEASLPYTRVVEALDLTP